MIFKPACSATDTNKEIETSFIARLDMIHSNKHLNNKGTDQTAQAGLCLCCLQTPKDWFSRVEAQLM